MKVMSGGSLLTAVPEPPEAIEMLAPATAPVNVWVWFRFAPRLVTTDLWL